MSDEKEYGLTSRRYAVVAAGLAAVLLAGVTSAQAAPAKRDARHVTATSAAGVRAQATGDSTFTPITPIRVMDTRNGSGPIGPNSAVPLNLTAYVPSTATAVVLNVTGTEPTANTFLSVYPDGIQRPEVSTVNLDARQTRPNSTTVALGQGGKVDVYNSAGTTHAVIDLQGYYTTDTTGSLFTTVSPVRMLDTRNSAPVPAHGEVTVDFSSLPSTVTAVTFNLTGLDASANTFVTAYPDGQARPNTSNLNYGPGQIVPGLVTVTLGASRKVRLYNEAGATDLFADLSGYYDPTQGAHFRPVLPQRQFDTRTDPQGPLNPLLVYTLNWPPAAPPKAIVGNLTGTNSTKPDFVVVWPAGSLNPPLASNLNIMPGQTVANAFAVGVAPDPGGTGPGSNFGNSQGFTDIIVDLTGVFV